MRVYNLTWYIFTGVFLRGTFKFRRISRWIWIVSRSAAKTGTSSEQIDQPLSNWGDSPNPSRGGSHGKLTEIRCSSTSYSRIQQCPTRRKFFPSTCRTTLLSLIQSRNPTASVTSGWITPRSRQCSVIITLFLHRQDSTWPRIHHRIITTLPQGVRSPNQSRLSTILGIWRGIGFQARQLIRIYACWPVRILLSSYPPPRWACHLAIRIIVTNFPVQQTFVCPPATSSRTWRG